MAKDYFYVRVAQLEDTFNIIARCHCHQYFPKSTFTVTTSTKLDEKNSKKLITGIRIFCNNCTRVSCLDGLEKHNKYEEDLDWT